MPVSIVIVKTTLLRLSSDLFSYPFLRDATEYRRCGMLGS